jgi:hypothetical protein
MPVSRKSLPAIFPTHPTLHSLKFTHTHTARSFVLRSDAPSWPKDRQRMIWDAIALHGIANIALYKEYEVALVSAASTIDFAGPAIAKQQYGDLVTVTQDEWETIAKAFPGNGEKKLFIGQLINLCRTKPETTYDNFVGDFGEKYLANYSRFGKRAVDLMEKVLLD